MALNFDEQFAGVGFEALPGPFTGTSGTPAACSSTAAGSADGSATPGASSSAAVAPAHPGTEAWAEEGGRTRRGGQVLPKGLPADEGGTPHREGCVLPKDVPADEAAAGAERFRDAAAPPPEFAPSGLDHGLHYATSASNLLAGLRSIRTRPGAGAGGAGLLAQATGDESRSQAPRGAGPAAATAAEPALPAVAGTSAASADASASSSQSQQQVAATRQEAQEDATAAGSTGSTPRYRSAAVQRLAQIFGRDRRARHGEPPLGGGGSPASAADGAVALGVSPGDEEEDATSSGAGSPPVAWGSWSGGGLLSPVQRYIEHRKAKLEEGQRTSAAAGPKRLDAKSGDAARGAAALPDVAGSPRQQAAVHGGLAAALWSAGAGLEVPPSLAQAQAEVTTELLQEAVELEAHVSDPTATLIVSMLAKKLERMAEESRRKERRRRRKAARAAAAAAAAAAVPAAAEAAPKAGPEAPPEAQLLAAGGGMGRLFRDPGTLTFFALATLLGFGHGLIGAFLFVFLSELGGNEALMGYVLMANALPELPAFYYFGSILSTLGMNTVLLLATTVLGLRICAYTLLPRLGVWWVLPLEVLHAITYAFGWSACAINSSKIAPPGLESTTQAVFQGLWTGVGCGLGGLLGGLLYASAGGQVLFGVAGAIIIAGSLLCLGALLVLRWRRKRREGQLALSASYSSLPGDK